MSLDPSETYRSLRDQDRLPLGALPRSHGIYALFDHAGTMRYVGITPGDRHGFHGRINRRHVTGSEGNSHKFSYAYNTGRMWRAKGDRNRDAKIAKDLKTAFIRRHCKAAVVAVDPEFHAGLLVLESAVKAMAPPGMLTWNDARSFAPCEEPADLVDRLVRDLAFGPEMIAAVERQRARSLLR